MASVDQIDERLRALRIELGQRAIKMHMAREDLRADAQDSPYAAKVGKEISKLIDEERLEQARARLKEELEKHPRELMFLNLQMALDMIDKPFGDYNAAKKMGLELVENAVAKGNSYYIRVALNNMGLIAHYEDQAEFSKVLYLAALHIDRKAIAPIQNLVCWCSRRNELQEAQMWVELLLGNCPDWLDNKEIVSFFLKHESLANLREYGPFREKILDVIQEHGKR
jgi:hypothetical protein